MKHLITSSLLDSFDFLKSCPDSWKDNALDDFISMLRREKRPTSDACQRGIDFERLICDNFSKTNEEYRAYISDYYKYKILDEEKYLDAVNSVCTVFECCKDGQQQVPVMKDIKIDGIEYHLFGYADIVFPEKIIDIKTTGNYKGSDSYLKRSQHYIYSLCTGIMNFEYVIAVFGGKYPKEVLKVIINDISESDCMEILTERIRNVTDFIQRAGLWEDYENIFTKEHKDYK